LSGTWHFYGLGLKDIHDGVVDLGTDTFKLMLTTSSYTPNQDTDHYRSTPEANEVVGTAYSAGGATLAGGSLTYDTGTNQVRMAWTSPTWSTSTITARTAVIYKSRGGASSADEVVAYCTEAGDISSTGGTFTVTLPSPTLYTTAS
jgi:hypothetical protein